MTDIHKYIWYIN